MKNGIKRGCRLCIPFGIIVLLVCAMSIIYQLFSPSEEVIPGKAIHAFQYITANGPFIFECDTPSQSDIADSMLLWLVNQANSLPPGYTPKNLVTHRGIHLHASAYTAYIQMLNAMQADNIHGLQLVSAYRSYEYQYGLFEAKVRHLISQGYDAKTADKLAAETIQRPGASEHQTGLALDVTLAGDLTQSFADTKAGQWLAANSHNFGFIIRYPQAKTDVTNIIYEPWHLRYVGVPHAAIMYKNNLVLEEYSQFISAGYAYIFWDGQDYYLVTHSGSWPQKIPQGLTDISSDRPGEGGRGYIMTFLREQTTYR